MARLTRNRSVLSFAALMLLLVAMLCASPASHVLVAAQEGGAMEEHAVEETEEQTQHTYAAGIDQGEEEQEEQEEQGKESIGSDANSGVEENEEEDKTVSWIAVAISLAVILGIQAHKSFAKYADYNHILKEEVFQNDGRGYLNMGLWMERDLADLEGDDDEIVQSIYDAIDKANSLELSSDAVPNFSFKDAQERMYQLFFCLGEFKSKKKLKVLETGPGSCEHYLLWDEWGMRTENSCFEKYTEPSVAFLKGQKAARKGSSLSKVQRFQRLAETVGDNGEKYDRIVAVESAFHYPDRAGFFQKCYDALNPGGKLIMTDLVSNPDYSQNALWDFVWGYYWQKVLTTPKENSSVDMHEYEEQIRSCGFSKVVVIDITALALRPFYEQFAKNVEVGSNAEYLQSINLYFCSLLSSQEKSVYPMSYSFALCVK